MTTNHNYLTTGDSFTLTCALSEKVQIVINGPGERLGINCGACLVDNPTEGFLGSNVRLDTTATYTVDCIWGDTGTLIFRVDNTSDMEFGNWSCGETGLPRGRNSLGWIYHEIGELISVIELIRVNNVLISALGALSVDRRSRGILHISDTYPFNGCIMRSYTCILPVTPWFTQPYAVVHRAKNLYTLKPKTDIYTDRNTVHRNMPNP